MPKSNKSRYAILGMLALAPNSSGYDIKKMMESSTQYFWKETFSSIYPVLQESRDEGLVVEQENPVQSGRQKNVYTLTSKGKKILKEWLSKPVEDEQFRNELLLKLFFGEVVPPSINRQHVEEAQKGFKQKLQTYLHIKNQLLAEHQDDPGLPYWLLTLDFGLGQVQAALEWCEHANNQIKKLEER